MARSIAEIENLLDSPDWKQRASAADDIGEMRDPKGLPALLRALEDDSQFVRMAATRSLGRVGDKKGVPALLEALNDPVFMVRMNAMWSLGEIGDASALASLQTWTSDQSMLSERAITVGQLAQIAIQRIEAKGAAVQAAPAGAPTRAAQPAASGGTYVAISDEDKERKKQEALARKAARTGGTPPPELSKEELEKRVQEAAARKAAKEAEQAEIAAETAEATATEAASIPAPTASATPAETGSSSYVAISDEDKERKRQEALARKAARAGGVAPAAPAPKPAAAAPKPAAEAPAEAAPAATAPAEIAKPAAPVASAPASDSAYVPLTDDEKERKRAEALARKAARQKGQ